MTNLIKFVTNFAVKYNEKFSLRWNGFRM